MSPSRHPGALNGQAHSVAADHLAEILVTRHAERTFAASEQSWWMQRERFGHQEPDRIRGDFGRKVRLAARDRNGPWLG
jgi:hypothetical protein